LFLIGWCSTLTFFSVATIYLKLPSYSSALDLAKLGKLQTGRLLSWLHFLLDRRACYSTCRWLQDFVITPSRSLHLHNTQGLVRHGYPWVPTNQDHDRPQQVGPTHQKTSRPDSGPNRPDLWSQRPSRRFLQTTLSNIRLGVHAKTSTASPGSPKITG
jgi:hypothetical protein